MAQAKQVRVNAIELNHQHTQVFGTHWDFNIQYFFYNLRVSGGVRNRAKPANPSYHKTYLPEFKLTATSLFNAAVNVVHIGVGLNDLFVFGCKLKVQRFQ
jgi:hypothetical protein